MTTLDERVRGLIDWMDMVGLQSGDPFTLQCSDFGVYFGKMSPLYITTGLSIIDKKFPWLSNTIISHRKAAHSSGMYAQACLLMYRNTQNTKYSLRAKEQLAWLICNTNKEYKYTWGIPFKWLMGDGVLAPENTPMSTVTPYCSDAFYLASKWHDSSCLNIALSNADFILNHLKHTYEDEDKLCLSYSPLDSFRIINVQAYCSAQLYRAYVHTGETKYRTTAEKLVNYVLSEQNEDGSWYYWAKQPKPPVSGSVDSLHQCYIIQGLYRSYLISREQETLDSVIRCMNYCKNNLITKDLLVKKFPDVKHPYELIDSAEMISTMDMLGHHSSADRLLNQTIKHFSIKDKPYFASRLDPRNNIPYIRWGEVQMLFTMAQHVGINNGTVSVQEIYT